jgi:hypothetical protein
MASVRLFSFDRVQVSDVDAQRRCRSARRSLLQRKDSSMEE